MNELVTFREALAKAEAKSGPETSPLRLAIRAAFADIEAARNRRVSWAAIAEMLADAGIAGANGTVPTAASVSVAYHYESYSKGGRRNSQRGKKPATPARATPAARVQSIPSPAPTDADRAAERLACLLDTHNRRGGR